MAIAITSINSFYFSFFIAFLLKQSHGLFSLSKSLPRLEASRKGKNETGLRLPV
jgi:hypothetical protein